MGVAAAYAHKLKTGEGQRVDTSLFEAGIIQTYWQSAIAFATGVSPGPLGSAHPLSAPYQAFETKDGWITLGASNQKTWRQFLEVLDAPDIADDPRFADNAGRMANLPALIAALTSALPAALDGGMAGAAGEGRRAGRAGAVGRRRCTRTRRPRRATWCPWSSTPPPARCRPSGCRSNSRAHRVRSSAPRPSTGSTAASFSSEAGYTLSEIDDARRRKCGSRAIPATWSAERMTERVVVDGLSVAKVLYDFINKEVLPGTGVSEAAFWTRARPHRPRPGAEEPRAARRSATTCRRKIDAWHRARKGQPFDLPAYKAFLGEIGYLVPEGPDFAVDTANVDDEIARIAGPQLVVPVTNARYALNAANARWGSLYDALYGTDAMPEDGGATRGGSYNPVRGNKVFALDQAVPRRDRAAGRGLARAGARLCRAGRPAGRQLRERRGDLARQRRAPDRPGGSAKLVGLADPAQFVGYRGNPSEPRAILLKHNGLHAEIQIDNRHYIGKADNAGVADVMLEAAITTIVDLEDFDRRRRSRRQGCGLSQLAGPDARHAHRGRSARAASR